MGAFDTPVAKCLLINDSTAESYECQFNPNTLQRTTKALYTRARIPGLSYEPLQFINTGNAQLSSLTFQMDAIAKDGSFSINDFVGFVMAFLYPVKGPGSGPQLTRPPELLFIWPGTLSAQGVVTNVQENYRLFFKDGSPRFVELVVGFEEKLDLRRYSEEVRPNFVITAADLAEPVEFEIEL